MNQIKTLGTLLHLKKLELPPQAATSSVTYRTVVPNKLIEHSRAKSSSSTQKKMYPLQRS